jgi:hypothetical protein
MGEWIVSTYINEKSINIAEWYAEYNLYPAIGDWRENVITHKQVRKVERKLTNLRVKLTDPCLPL